MTTSPNEFYETHKVRRFTTDQFENGLNASEGRYDNVPLPFPGSPDVVTGANSAITEVTPTAVDDFGDDDFGDDFSAFQGKIESGPPRAYEFGVPTSATTITATGDNNIDGLLVGTKWSSTSVSFSFTDSIDDYESNYADRTAHGASFQTLNTTQRDVAREWLGTGGEYYNVSLLSPYELSGTSDQDATIRMASSTVPSTAFAYYPNGSFVEGGDAWFNPYDYNSPVIGNYAYHTFGHELGHALGLKHGHETGGVNNVAMNSNRDSMEFSIMTYRSYEGHNLSALPYYTNETWGFAQSLMMYDIRAIQEMYGAWFGANSGDTNYTFSTTTGEMTINGVGQGTPGANRVFRTIWDGSGIDTYDFSNYTTNLSVKLAPGSWSDLDVGGNFQRAMLNAGYGGITKYARGQVFNALQYKGDARSLIENAKGGSGNDSIAGNGANNLLNGNGGNDSLSGGSFNDTLIGGLGNDSLAGGNNTDTASYASASAAVTVNLSSNTATGGAGSDTLSSIEGVVGSKYKDSLVGNSSANTLTGGAGKDTLTGGGGADKFTYTALTESLLSAFDIITDFTSSDKIDAPSSVSAATLTTSVGNAASLSGSAIAAVLTSSVFTANVAKAFTVSGQTGTFVALNNGTAGFSSSTDSIIFLQNYTLGSVAVV